MASPKNKLIEWFAPYLLILLFGFAVMFNSFLVTTVQTAVKYPHQDPQVLFPDNFEVLDAHCSYDVNGYLLWVDNQQWHLLITEKHFKADRWRTVCDITLQEQNYSGEFSVQSGSITVQVDGYDDFAAFRWDPSFSYRTLKIPTDHLLWNSGLLLLEMVSLFLLRKLRGS